MSAKIVRLGTSKDGHTFCKIQLKTEDGFVRLSISGVEGPMLGGDARGSCGQFIMSFKEYDERGHKTLDSITPAPGWTPELIRQFFDVWDRWHLNDMRAGCEHQRAENWGKEKIEVVSYKQTHEAYKIRKEAEKKAATAAVEGQPAELTETEKALLSPDCFKDIYVPPDADSPLSGYYEVNKRETKTSGCVYEYEHPRGVLCKPCPTCGHKYGSAWLKEPLPPEVISFIESLPETDKTPAWV